MYIAISYIVHGYAPPQLLCVYIIHVHILMHMYMYARGLIIMTSHTCSAKKSAGIGELANHLRLLYESHYGPKVDTAEEMRPAVTTESAVRA